MKEFHKEGWLKEEHFYGVDSILNTIGFFKEYDKRHNLNIRKVFPEMKQFFDICEMEANKW